MDLSVKTETFQQDDQSWLASAHGTDTARPITLDVSTFTANTHYPNGYIKSGVLLGKITASGRYGPYDGAATDGRQTAAGFLLDAVKAPASTSTPVQGALLWHGAVLGAKTIPANPTAAPSLIAVF
jgi:hypothetical protein